MKLHTVFVTYNRLELTRRTIASYMDTVSSSFHFTVVDNGSTDGTEEWLAENIHHDGGCILLGQNFYPGKAANLGWAVSQDDVTHLHRSDNDMEYLPGWCDEVEDRFRDPKLGQLGLRTLEEEGPHAAVGGNMILRRDVYNAGARYDGRPWTEEAFEDAILSHRVHKLGYRWERVRRPCVVHIGIASSQDPYYQQTFAERGITFAQYGIA